MIYSKLNSRSATFRIRLNADEHARALDYFHIKGSRLSLMSGDLYCQGRGWFLVMLNEEKFTPEVAYDRFVACMRVALERSQQIAEHVQEVSHTQKIISIFSRRSPVRVVPVRQVRHHGRVFSVSTSRMLSAALNINTELEKDIHIAFSRRDAMTAWAAPRALSA